MTTKRVLTIIGLSIAGILLLVAVFTSWYTVDESEQAVIITFGEAGETVTESGLHFKMPWPIQKAEVMSKETYSLQFGYDQNEDGEVTAYDKETKMITGDENIVLTDLVVQWKITDPKKFLFNAEDPREMLHDATSASIRSIIGSSLIDDALTSGKAEIEAETRDLLSSLIEEYDIGISVLAVKLQDVELPNEEVRAAFTNVTDARETMNTKINEANKYENQKRNEALGEKSAINSRAEAQKVERVEQARGDVAVFDKLYAEYESNPEVTRQRLVMETLESVLPDAKLYIMNDDEGTMKYLPLGEMQTAIPPAAEEETTEEGGGN
ncbi:MULTISPECIES: FtsH protease activity modulator HflK [unclassified Planococcus (in: firmicutes)]|uniref:FtsH protease activity modulator HflK n=1 Tax=Planococcus TaxID=1372 RepID=UPI000C32B686|nr:MULTISPECIES: FtsH protease activity modulator HflK [unclassified Planococcus (in: firmicutes)]AUD13612.1 FtsH protease activity modulator HflK [Planococcus sp. MB-3u-03]PKG44501.1 FtsH protease activity modulator HflK [Planococcus sp. Urea-trap-24]PKG91317.1 FtsH protease activity modulator HflK [Planococcus sp. Urea-3u-39]PKH39802.1 FtsH protease activity modulator HflK [Planococcus sp. MB-3u-09]